jgi:hypothetical protein
MVKQVDVVATSVQDLFVSNLGRSAEYSKFCSGFPYSRGTR